MSADLPDLDYKLLFEHAPGVFLVLRAAPDFTILAASDGYLDATHTRRDAIVGRPLFEVFPGERRVAAAGGSRLAASLNRVLATRVVDAMADQPFDERSWSWMNLPVITAAGEFPYIIHRVENISSIIGADRDNDPGAVSRWPPGHEFGETAQPFRVSSERSLNRREAHLEAVLDNITDGVMAVGLDGQMLHFNPAALRIHDFAAPDEGLIHFPEFTRIFEFSTLDGHFLPVDEWALARILRGETLQGWQASVRKVGTNWQRIFSYGGTLARDADGAPWIAVLTVRDVTDQVRAEQRLQQQLERLHLLAHITRAIGERQDLQSIFQVVIGSVEESLPVDFGCMCLYDAAANAITVTSVGVKSTALAIELIMTEQARIDIDENGLSCCVSGQLVYEPDVSRSPFPFPQRLARAGLRALVAAPLQVENKVFGLLVVARRQPESFSSGECEFLQQLTEHVALASNQAQLNGALQIAYDDLRQTQQAVMQQERLHAMGQMASGIAHDINNAISPASLYVEALLEREPGLSAQGRERLATIQGAIDDVAQTVRRMREIYRQHESELTLVPVDLNSLAMRVADLTRARWRDMPQERGVQIELRCELASDLPVVLAVESEIRQALMNLVFNAADAMPEGGTLTLRTCHVDKSGERGWWPQVALQVVDTGAGMNDETRLRCLEPFFTTKGERGTGLGLAMVYKTMQRHNADIDIDSAPGLGTAVSLRFTIPAGQAAAAESAPAHEPRPASRLRLLVVDDDPLIIKSLRDALEGDGHEIVAAMGGQEGIDAFHAARQAAQPFAAVITDLGMPRVDGRQVASAVKGVSAATPVILLTGWGHRLVAEGDVPPHVDRVLNKPPKLRELRAALAAMTT